MGWAYSWAGAQLIIKVLVSCKSQAPALPIPSIPLLNNGEATALIFKNPRDITILICLEEITLQKHIRKVIILLTKAVDLETKWLSQS